MIADQRERHQPVAEDRLAGVGRDDLGDDPEAGQDHDVDGGVGVEPEDVLVADDVAAGGGLEEVGAAGARSKRTMNWTPAMNGVAATTSSEVARFAQTKQRHPPEGHPRRAHGDDRDQEVERREDRGEAGELDADVEERLPERRPGRERRVAGPAGVEGAAGNEEAGHEEDPGERQEPEAERVQPREGHVRRAEHQRQDVVGDPGEDRDHEQEDHDRRVSREEPVVDRGSTICVPGWASSARISIASKPPMKKKKKVVTMYWMPITL